MCITYEINKNILILLYRYKITGFSVPMTRHLIKRTRSAPIGLTSIVKLQHFITVTTLICTALVSFKGALFQSTRVTTVG